MRYSWTMGSALEYARAGRIENWVHEFLRQDGNNKALSEGLKLCPRHYLGPIQFDIGKLSRCAGPEPGMKYRGSVSSFESRVRNIQDAIAAGFDLPPLIVNYSGGRLELNDGNHRLEALNRSGRQHFGVIFWTTERAEMAALSKLLEGQIFDRGQHPPARAADQS